MTVSSLTTKNSYSGNASTSAFSYTFKIFDDDDVTVIIRTDSTGTETVKTKTTHYTVSGVGSASGGTITFTSGNIPASGETVLLLRNTPLTQATDYTPNDPFPAATHEDALDKLTLISQDTQEEIDRSIKLSRANTMTSTEFTVPAATRANKIFGFDASGELTVTQELGTFKGDWAASTSYVARDLVRDTSTTSIFIVNEAHTSSGSLPLTTNTNSSKYTLILESAFSGVTAGTVSASKGVLVDSNKDITGFRNVTLSGNLTLGSGAVINEAELEAIDGVTAGTVAASKAVVVDSNKDAASFRNITLTGELDAGSLDVSGDADIDGTLETDALSINGTAVTATGAELNYSDTGAAVGTVVASKVVTADANKDVASFRNITLTGELDAGSLDVSGDADIDGTLEADAITLNGTAITATATLDTGISNNNVPKFTSGVADNDFLRVDGTAIEGRSASEVLSDIGATTATAAANEATALAIALG
jgi:cytoskeletal protein CcmA (bactofilin family)|tara:strand:- start:30 stop:1472 length:1443 start_codon:yes stop_codon:yes gene_type:complete